MPAPKYGIIFHYKERSKTGRKISDTEIPIRQADREEEKCFSVGIVSLFVSYVYFHSESLEKSLPIKTGCGMDVKSDM